MRKVLRVAVALLILATAAFATLACNSVSEISIEDGDLKQTVFVEGNGIDFVGSELTVKRGNDVEKIPLDSGDIVITDNTDESMNTTKGFVGIHELTAEYKGKKANFTVEVVKRLQISNVDLDYFVGEDFNKSKGYVTLTQNNGTKNEPVPISTDDVTITGFDNTKEQLDLELTIKYAGFEDTFKVNVYEISGEPQFVAPTDTQYDSHETQISTAGGKFVFKNKAGTYTKDVPLTSSMIVEKDVAQLLSVATYENNYKRKTGAQPATATVNVQYGTYKSSFTIRVYFSEISRIYMIADELKDAKLYRNNQSTDELVDWSKKKVNIPMEINPKDRELALEAVDLYFDLGKSQSDVDLNRFVIPLRFAADYYHDRWVELMNTFCGDDGIIDLGYDTLYGVSELGLNDRLTHDEAKVQYDRLTAKSGTDYENMTEMNEINEKLWDILGDSKLSGLFMFMDETGDTGMTIAQYCIFAVEQEIVDTLIAEINYALTLYDALNPLRSLLEDDKQIKLAEWGNVDAALANNAAIDNGDATKANFTKINDATKLLVTSNPYPGNRLIFNLVANWFKNSDFDNDGKPDGDASDPYRVIYSYWWNEAVAKSDDNATWITCASLGNSSYFPGKLEDFYTSAYNCISLLEGLATSSGTSGYYVDATQFYYYYFDTMEKLEDMNFGEDNSDKLVEYIYKWFPFYYSSFKDEQGNMRPVANLEVIDQLTSYGYFAINSTMLDVPVFEPAIKKYVELVQDYINEQAYEGYSQYAPENDAQMTFIEPSEQVKKAAKISVNKLSGALIADNTDDDEEKKLQEEGYKLYMQLLNRFQTNFEEFLFGETFTEKLTDNEQPTATAEDETEETESPFNGFFNMTPNEQFGFLYTLSMYDWIVLDISAGGQVLLTSIVYEYFTSIYELGDEDGSAALSVCANLLRSIESFIRRSSSQNYGSTYSYNCFYAVEEGWYNQDENGNEMTDDPDAYHESYDEVFGDDSEHKFDEGAQTKVAEHLYSIAKRYNSFFDSNGSGIDQTKFNAVITKADEKAKNDSSLSNPGENYWKNRIQKLADDLGHAYRTTALSQQQTEDGEGNPIYSYPVFGAVIYEYVKVQNEFDQLVADIRKWESMESNKLEGDISLLDALYFGEYDILKKWFSDSQTGSGSDQGDSGSDSGNDSNDEEIYSTNIESILYMIREVYMNYASAMIQVSVGDETPFFYDIYREDENLQKYILEVADFTSVFIDSLYSGDSSLNAFENYYGTDATKRNNTIDGFIKKLLLKPTSGTNDGTLTVAEKCYFFDFNWYYEINDDGSYRSDMDSFRNAFIMFYTQRIGLQMDQTSLTNIVAKLWNLAQAHYYYQNRLDANIENDALLSTYQLQYTNAKSQFTAEYNSSRLGSVKTEFDKIFGNINGGMNVIDALLATPTKTTTSK